MGWANCFRCCGDSYRLCLKLIDKNLALLPSIINCSFRIRQNFGDWQSYFLRHTFFVCAFSADALSMDEGGTVCISLAR